MACNRVSLSVREVGLVVVDEPSGHSHTSTHTLDLLASLPLASGLYRNEKQRPEESSEPSSGYAFRRGAVFGNHLRPAKTDEGNTDVPAPL